MDRVSRFRRRYALDRVTLDEMRQMSIPELERRVRLLHIQSVVLTVVACLILVVLVAFVLVELS